MEFRQLRYLLPWPRSCTSAGRPSASRSAGRRSASRSSPWSASRRAADPRPQHRADRGGTGPARARPQRQRGGHLRRPGGAGGRRRHDQAAGRISGRAASASVPLAVRIFRERFPSVALDTVVGRPARTSRPWPPVSWTRALVRLAGANGDNLAFRPLHREPVHVAIPEPHPLARLRAVRAGHLANEPIVLFPRALDPPLHDHRARRPGRLRCRAVGRARGDHAGEQPGRGRRRAGDRFRGRVGGRKFTVRGVEFRPLVTVARRCSSAGAGGVDTISRGCPAVPRRSPSWPG